jgi:hypothetical protein
LKALLCVSRLPLSYNPCIGLSLEEIGDIDLP